MPLLCVSWIGSACVPDEAADLAAEDAWTAPPTADAAGVSARDVGTAGDADGLRVDAGPRATLDGGGGQPDATDAGWPDAARRAEVCVDVPDRAVTDDGLEAVEWLAGRGVDVEALDAEDRVVGRARTDANGCADVPAPDGPFRARAIVRVRRGRHVVEVTPLDDGRPWALDLGPDLDPDGLGAALHIARTAADAIERFTAATGRADVEAPTLRIAWEPGRAGSCGTCFRRGRAPRIDLSGRAADPDEWDDAVIHHEVGHYVASVFGRDDSPGGPHDGRPTRPTLAWSEGFAIFHASWQGDDPVQRDLRATGVKRTDLDALDDPTFFGTANGALDGPVSEFLVAGLLWSLGPATADAGAALLLPVLDWLGDRGAVGMDLVDHLDGLACDGGVGPVALDDAITARMYPYPGSSPCDEGKTRDALTIASRPDGTVIVDVLRAGVLTLDPDGGTRSVSAGEKVVWRPAPHPDTPMVGATLIWRGQRDVVSLFLGPEPKPTPRRLVAGAWMPVR
jgi:hypothetical protein